MTLYITYGMLGSLLLTEIEKRDETYAQTADKYDLNSLISMYFWFRSMFVN
jgi:hypothetical protein